MAEYGMKSIEILRSATSVNARIFGMADLGNIRAGALADLIVVAVNPIENISGLRTIKVVMKDGKIYRNEILGK
jgi:imidazolonepropionase-like amidohydrolase